MSLAPLGRQVITCLRVLQSGHTPTRTAKPSVSSAARKAARLAIISRSIKHESQKVAPVFCRNAAIRWARIWGLFITYLPVGVSTNDCRFVRRAPLGNPICWDAQGAPLYFRRFL